MDKKFYWMNEFWKEVNNNENRKFENDQLIKSKVRSLFTYLLGEKDFELFLYFYPLFATPKEIFQLFKDSYDLGDNTNDKETLRSLILLQLSNWIFNFSITQENSKELTIEITNFLDTFKNEPSKKKIVSITKKFMSIVPKNIIPEVTIKMNFLNLFLNLSDEVIAEVFTLYFQDLRKKYLKVHDVVCKRKDYDYYYDQYVLFIATLIVYPESSEIRSKMYHKMVRIGHMLMKITNLETLNAIYLALFSDYICKLKIVVPKNVEIEAKNIKQMLAPKNHNDTLRSLWNLRSPPKLFISSILNSVNFTSIYKDNWVDWVECKKVFNEIKDFIEVEDYKFKTDMHHLEQFQCYFSLKQINHNILEKIAILREPDSFSTFDLKQSKIIIEQFMLETEFHQEDFLYYYF